MTSALFYSQLTQNLIQWTLLLSLINQTSILLSFYPVVICLANLYWIEILNTMAAIIPCHYCSSLSISKLPRSHIPWGNISHVNAARWGRQLSLRCSLKSSQKAQLHNKLVFVVFVWKMVPLIEYIRSGLFQQIYDIRFDILIQI